MANHTTSKASLFQRMVNIGANAEFSVTENLASYSW